MESSGAGSLFVSMVVSIRTVRLPARFIVLSASTTVSFSFISRLSQSIVLKRLSKAKAGKHLNKSHTFFVFKLNVGNLLIKDFSLFSLASKI